jgi:plasmid stabilization system protein ParE
MSYALVVRPTAGRDIAEAYEYYSQHERGDALMASIDHVFTQIVDRPLMYPVVYDEVRRALLRRFAYSVFFIVETTDVVVLAVHHQRRDPSLRPKP